MKSVSCTPSRRQDGHVAVGQKIHVARVVQNARDIGRDKRLALAHADDHRRPGARGDNLVRLGRRQNPQRERAGQPLHRHAHGLFQAKRRTRRFGVLLHLFDQVRNDLRVGLGDELVALGDQFALQLEVVLDDPVVHHHDAPGAIAMRMSIFLGRPAVRGPAGVANAEGAVQRMVAQNFFQIVQLAGRARHRKPVDSRTAHRDSGRIVTAIFEAPQPLNNDRNHLLGSYISDNAAHVWILRDYRQDIRGSHVRDSQLSSFLNAVREFLDDRVGEHFAGDAFHLGAGRVGAQAVGQRNGEILALAHAGNI